MPRARAHTKEQVLKRAMERFWHHGFNATSMDDLVKATKVSRHGLYSDFAGKEELFLACLCFYNDEIVSPAFQRVEAPEAGLKEISEYFSFQVELAIKAGLPGPGCLIANTLTEVAPHDTQVMQATLSHNSRLRKGFAKALSNSNEKVRSKTEIGELATFLVLSAQGLWSISRTVSKPAALRRHASTLITLVENRIRS